MNPVSTKGKLKEAWFSNSLVSESSKIIGDSTMSLCTLILWPSYNPILHFSIWVLGVLYALIIFPMMLSPVCLPTWISVFDPCTCSLSLCWDRHHLEDVLLMELLTLETVQPIRLVNISNPQVPYAPTMAFPLPSSPIIFVTQKTE